ncbi:MAG: hypothetical protein IPM38_16445 [Ignavibacteria bacterium]|nr:hypothetical protein [Ignavibacteria bacterium]
MPTLDMTASVLHNGSIGSNGRLNDLTVTGDTIYYHSSAVILYRPIL